MNHSIRETPTYFDHSIIEFDRTSLSYYKVRRRFNRDVTSDDHEGSCDEIGT